MDLDQMQLVYKDITGEVHDGLGHYTEKMDSYFKNKIGSTCTVEEFQKEFSKFESEYLAGIPMVAKMTLNMLKNGNERFLYALGRYTK